MLPYDSSNVSFVIVRALQVDENQSRTAVDESWWGSQNKTQTKVRPCVLQSYRQKGDLADLGRRSCLHVDQILLNGSLLARSVPNSLDYF